MTPLTKALRDYALDCDRFADFLSDLWPAVEDKGRRSQMRCYVEQFKQRAVELRRQSADKSETPA